MLMSDIEVLKEQKNLPRPLCTTPCALRLKIMSINSSLTDIPPIFFTEKEINMAQLFWNTA